MSSLDADFVAEKLGLEGISEVGHSPRAAPIARSARDRPVRRQPPIRRPFPAQLPPHGVDWPARGGSRRPGLQGRPVEGGGGGIRTLVGPKWPETVFETAAFNHSATPPRWCVARLEDRLGRASAWVPSLYVRDRELGLRRGRGGRAGAIRAQAASLTRASGARHRASSPLPGPPAPRLGGDGADQRAGVGAGSGELPGARRPSSAIAT